MNRDKILAKVDTMDALCEKGREQVKDLLCEMHGWEAPTKGDGLWIPELDETYWYITFDGAVIYTTYCGDSFSFRYGNVFRTREQAERHLISRAFHNRLELLADELNPEGWWPDWTLVGTTIGYVVEWIDKGCGWYWGATRATEVRLGVFATAEIVSKAAKIVKTWPEAEAYRKMMMGEE